MGAGRPPRRACAPRLDGQRRRRLRGDGHRRTGTTADCAGAIVQGKIEDLPFPDAASDVAIATGVLEYADVDAALRELRRVLRPAGVAVVSYPNPGNFYWTWRTHVWYRGAAFAKRLLRQPPLVFPTLADAHARGVPRAARGCGPRSRARPAHELPRPPVAVRQAPAADGRAARTARRARRATALRRLSGQVVLRRASRPTGADRRHGRSGFVGRHLISALRRRRPEATVRSFDARPLDGEHPHGVETAVGSIEDEEAVHGAVAGADVVVHLAARVAPEAGDSEQLWRVNVEGTRNAYRRRSRRASATSCT